MSNNSNYKQRILPLEGIISFVKEQQEEGKTIVTTNGSFDLLHPGHIFLLEESKKQGDILVVGVNSDASVKRYKGPDRPIDGQDVRAENVSRLADAVFIFEEDDPREWLKMIHPDVHCNAETYGEDCIEADVLKEIGARLHLVKIKPEFGSTTQIIQQQLET
jgi:D-glycero-beta-D-manno-heptose 1-phosphate adenylyltransferase